MNVRHSTIGLLVGATSAVSACAWLASRGDHINFSHKLHQEQAGACSDCHASGPSMSLPAKARCAECHDDTDRPEACAKCHTDPKHPAGFAREDRGLIFSHALHAERASTACVDCHPAIPTADGRSRRAPGIRPGHDQCRGCHAALLEEARCEACHRRLPLDARKPEEFFRHAPDYLARHGGQARGAEDVCAQCHDQSYCAECHGRYQTVRPSIRFPERSDRAFMHRGDYTARHAIDAAAHPASCLKCHGPATCDSCHERRGVGGAVVTGARTPHGVGWLNPLSSHSHSREARKNITLCAGCHDQGPSSACVRCHASGGVNPHPPGWAARHAKTDRGRQPCGICH